MRSLESSIAPSGSETNTSQAGDSLFLLDKNFGRLNDRKNGIALFEFHPLRRTSRYNRRHGSGRSSDDNF
jgi:hypothetical protein